MGGVAGVILAGGQGTRIGGNKPLRPLGGKPLLAHVIARARPQVGRLWLSAHANAAELAGFDLPIVDDADAHPMPGRDYAGPLAGILAGLTVAGRYGFDRLAVFPCDVPFFPGDLVHRLADRLDRAPEAVASIPAVAGEPIPVFGLWKVDEALAALAAMPAHTNRLKSVCHALGCVQLDCEGLGPGGSWLNVNTPEDLIAAEADLARSDDVSPSSPAEEGRGGGVPRTRGNCGPPPPIPPPAVA